MNWFKKDPIITFKCDPELRGGIPDPIPASEATPKWFRKIPMDYGVMANTVKRCIPFKDAMDMGYVLPLWVDLEVVNNGKKILFNYKNNSIIKPSVFGDHAPYQINGCPMADTTYGKEPMKFNSPWLITTPPGWSCMFIQPINHFDNRLHIITGVVDTDRYKSKINFPFIWMDKNFNGVIQKGSPLVQVIPFKRTEWSHRVGSISAEDSITDSRITHKLNTVFKNAYRLNWWTPKKYK